MNSDKLNDAGGMRIAAHIKYCRYESSSHADFNMAGGILRPRIAIDDYLDIPAQPGDTFQHLGLADSTEFPFQHL